MLWNIALVVSLVASWYSAYLAEEQSGVMLNMQFDSETDEDKRRAEFFRRGKIRTAAQVTALCSWALVLFLFWLKLKSM